MTMITELARIITAPHTSLITELSQLSLVIRAISTRWASANITLAPSLTPGPQPASGGLDLGWLQLHSAPEPCSVFRLRLRYMITWSWTCEHGSIFSFFNILIQWQYPISLHFQQLQNTFATHERLPSSGSISNLILKSVFEFSTPIQQATCLALVYPSNQSAGGQIKSREVQVRVQCTNKVQSFLKRAWLW